MLATTPAVATKTSDSRFATPSRASPRTASHPLAVVHRSVGNRAVANHVRNAIVDGSPRPIPASAIETLSTPGQPLDGPARSQMEAGFGADFGSVRVHTGPDAAAAANDLHTNAWTAGEHIVFASGAYGIDSRSRLGRLTHELTHVLEHRRRPGEALTIDRQPPGPSEARLLDQGLPAKGMDPMTGEFFDGHIDGEKTQRYLRGARKGEVYAPPRAPSLPAVPEALPVKDCGTVTGGMDPAKAAVIRDCITHRRYVNIMVQSSANIAAVPSTYSDGIASIYNSALSTIKASTTVATDTTPADYATVSTSVRVSAATTVPISSFTISLAQLGPGKDNGSWNALTNKLTLNETSASVLKKDQPDIERTMYHEMIHFLSDVTSFAAKKRTAPSPVIDEPALMPGVTGAFKGSFIAATKPIFTDMLTKVMLAGGAKTTAFTDEQLARAQWLRVENEFISRVEEAIYLALRAGRGFTVADMRALPQDWLTLTPAYWDSLGVFDETDLETYLKANAAQTRRNVLPIAQAAQERYMYLRRPS